MIVGSRESVRLAFVAALQHLSARQRAVLVLRDVLQWKAAEVPRRSAPRPRPSTACCSGPVRSSTPSDPARTTTVAAPESPEAQDLLARYIAAFENYDIDTLVELFTEEADLGDAALHRLVSGRAGHRHAHPSQLPGR